MKLVAMLKTVELFLWRNKNEKIVSDWWHNGGW